ncbi:MAG: hypothetical protein ACYC77_11940 [Coriobacteriia bacterium]
MPTNIIVGLVAFSAMFGVLAFTLMGMRATKAGNDVLRAAVARWMLAPWVPWLFIFVWGMASRGSFRMGG